MFHYTVETDKSVDDAIAALEQALAEEKFGVLWRFSIQDKLNEKGSSLIRSTKYWRCAIRLRRKKC